MKTLILGIGNPILSDDSIGLIVVRRLKEEKIKNIEVKETTTTGLDLLELMRGYRNLIAIDAMKTGKFPPGIVVELKREDIACALHLVDSHTIDFFTALELGRKLHPAEMPKKIVIFGIEVSNTTTFSENLTPLLQKKLPEIVRRLKKEIERLARTEVLTLSELK
ncbi:MAG: hydrogenase maturation protease [Candidatus Edwardsbacteria bacterium]